MALRFSPIRANFGNVEGLGRTLGSADAMAERRGMLTDLISPALDPMATSEQLRQSAIGALGIGEQDLALQLGQMAAAKTPVDLAGYYARNPSEPIYLRALPQKV